MASWHPRNLLGESVLRQAGQRRPADRAPPNKLRVRRRKCNKSPETTTVGRKPRKRRKLWGLFTELRKQLDLVERTVEEILDGLPYHAELKAISRIQNEVERTDALKAFAEAQGFPVLKCPECGSYHYKATDETFETHQCDDCATVWSDKQERNPGSADDSTHAAALELVHQAFESPGLRDLKRLE